MDFFRGGGDYASSLCAFSFLTLFSVAVISWSLGKSILRSLKYAQICTIAFLVLITSRFAIFSKGSLLHEVFDEAFLYALVPGNSARLIRGACPALYVCVVEGIFLYIKHCKYYKTSSEKSKKRIELLVISATAGLFFTYSNDYGISTWICACIIYVFVNFCRERTLLIIVKTGISYLLVSCMSIVIFVVLITHGHFQEWINATFGTGGFQRWYYLAGHSYYIYDVDFTFLILVQALMVIYYGVCLFVHRADSIACRRYGIPALINMTAFCAANEYKMLSGNYLHEAAYVILTCTIAYEALLTIKHVCNMEHKRLLGHSAIIFTIIIGGAWCISNGLTRGISSLNTNRGIYVEELGGYMSVLSEDLNVARDFLQGKKIFSTYATALEAVTDQYQPSGYDYIIHVLGENARRDYLKSFKEENFDYAVTIRAEYNDWENWIRNANWFFYRELYANYHPVFCNSYEMFWEKNDEMLCVIPGNEAMVRVEPLSDSITKIKVLLNETQNGVADIRLSYHTEKAQISKRESLMWFRCVNVKDTTPYQIYETERNTFNLPKEGSVNIPITVIDGEGEILISSLPDHFTNLYIDGVNCEQIYEVPFSYLDLVGNAEQISSGKCTILINNNNLNSKIVEHISQIILDDEAYDIIDVFSDDEYISLSFRGDANKFNICLGNANIVRVK